jgi:hypothetical protein
MDEILNLKFIMGGLENSKYKSLLIEEMRKHNLIPFLYIQDEKVLDNVRYKSNDSKISGIMIAIDYTNNPINC